MRIVITGGSGFIGTHFIADHHDKYHKLANIDIKPPIFESQIPFWHQIDLLDIKALKDFFLRFRPTHVLHLAARTDLDEKKNLSRYAVNIQGVDNLVHAIRKTPSIQRVIMASSMLVCKVGYAPRSFTDYSPGNLYAKSKVETELITQKSKLACTWTIVRPTTIWGPHHQRLQTGFFRILQKNLYFHPGNKKSRKSYGYVRNTVYQIQKIFESTPEMVHRKTMYLADSPIVLSEWVDAFSARLVGVKAKKLPYPLIKMIALGGDLLEYVFQIHAPMTSFRLRNMTIDNVVDTTLIDTLCSKLPFSLIDGVTETCSWIQDCKK
jgi:nucleoside-diphosphate-sugar epimerase